MQQRASVKRPLQRALPDLKECQKNSMPRLGGNCTVTSAKESHSAAFVSQVPQSAADKIEITADEEGRNAPLNNTVIQRSVAGKTVFYEKLEENSQVLKNMLDVLIKTSDMLQSNFDKQSGILVTMEESNEHLSKDLKRFADALWVIPFEKVNES